MKKSLFKKIIAVLLAFATLMFAGCQKDEPVNEENPSESISQNVDEETTSQEVESSDKDEETTKQEEIIIHSFRNGGVMYASQRSS